MQRDCIKLKHVSLESGLSQARTRSEEESSVIEDLVSAVQASSQFLESNQSISEHISGVSVSIVDEVSEAQDSESINQGSDHLVSAIEELSTTKKKLSGQISEMEMKLKAVKMAIKSAKTAQKDCEKLSKLERELQTNLQILNSTLRGAISTSQISLNKGSRQVARSRQGLAKSPKDSVSKEEAIMTAEEQSMAQNSIVEKMEFDEGTNQDDDDASEVVEEIGQDTISAQDNIVENLEINLDESGFSQNVEEADLQSNVSLREALKLLVSQDGQEKFHGATFTRYKKVSKFLTKL